MPKKNIRESKLAPPEKGVTVRMYDAGFGDCFLLAFRAVDGQARYVLIDCGVHHQYQGGDKRLERIAQDIAAATGNKLHIAVITHEHTDHIYGFMYGLNAFKDMQIENVWLAWTEDPTDPLARELKDLHRRRVMALQAAIAHLKAAASPLALNLEDLLGFDLSLDAAMALKGNQDILDDFRSWSKKKLVRPQDYRSPGESPLEIPDVKGIKCYVLGPPRDRRLIEKLADKEEMYLKEKANDKEDAFMAAVMAASETGTQEEYQYFDRLAPFDSKLSLEKQFVASRKDDKENKDYRDYREEIEFFHKHYGFADDESCGPKWRRIETDWLDAAGQLALNINRMTNNTSLVLAFELTETKPRKVLLFAGDAQVGNWLSWKELQFSGEGASDEKVSGLEIIKETVFYKVGHHGSLNATLREKGLELMNSPELVAMISVNEEWAKKRGWNHPEEKLVKRLMEKTRGRVIRSDKIPSEGSLSMPMESNEVDWKEFLNNLQWDESSEKLWIQFTVQ